MVTWAAIEEETNRLIHSKTNSLQNALHQIVQNYSKENEDEIMILPVN